MGPQIYFGILFCFLSSVHIFLFFHSLGILNVVTLFYVTDNSTDFVSLFLLSVNMLILTVFCFRVVTESFVMNCLLFLVFFFENSLRFVVKVGFSKVDLVFLQVSCRCHNVVISVIWIIILYHLSRIIFTGRHSHGNTFLEFHVVTWVFYFPLLVSLDYKTDVVKKVKK